ncbi:hypothetical protein NC99_26920 [Sunxiuqinia dokdonensis]|uniref:Uncharacterized protein n=1 Tax=Sunxiuqinia dokdonensis TaxID=1409788 RepID=A0A0L8V8D1_9BACT|nr:hypothetical protein NC99_26920 [Sunxiuqinia dokdonensis]
MTWLNGISVWFFPFPCGWIALPSGFFLFRLVKWLFRHVFPISVWSDRSSGRNFRYPRRMSGSVQVSLKNR